MKTSTHSSPSIKPVVDVATLHEDHPHIRAMDWRSPLIFKVGKIRSYVDGAATISASYRDEALAETNGSLSIGWSGLKTDFEQCLKTYQDHVLTEFATLGLACALLTHHTKFRITEVTRLGDKADYWIGDDIVPRRFLLEVGGRSTGSIDDLSIEKTNQLDENPYSMPGFICVAVYDSLNARLWFSKGTGTP